MSTIITKLDTCSHGSTSVQILGPFDLIHSHNSNRHFQWKSMGFHLKRHTVVRPLGPGVLYHVVDISNENYKACQKLDHCIIICGFHGSKFNFSITTNWTDKCP